MRVQIRARRVLDRAAGGACAGFGTMFVRRGGGLKRACAKGLGMILGVYDRVAGRKCASWGRGTILEGDAARLDSWAKEADDTMQGPEIREMYSLNMPVSAVRTKIRQEFERHRYVNQLKTTDVLLFNSHSEFQETLNYWKQLSHVLKYFQTDEDVKSKLPKTFMQGFIEVSRIRVIARIRLLIVVSGSELICYKCFFLMCQQ